MAELGTYSVLFRPSASLHDIPPKDSHYGPPVVPRGNQYTEPTSEARIPNKCFCLCRQHKRTKAAMGVWSTQGRVSFALIVQSSHDLGEIKEVCLSNGDTSRQVAELTILGIPCAFSSVRN